MFVGSNPSLAKKIIFGKLKVRQKVLHLSFLALCIFTEGISIVSPKGTVNDVSWKKLFASIEFPPWIFVLDLVILWSFLFNLPKNVSSTVLVFFQRRKSELVSLEILFRLVRQCETFFEDLLSRKTFYSNLIFFNFFVDEKCFRVSSRAKVI